MRFALARSRDGLAPRLGFHFLACGGGFFLHQQLQLQIAERFTGRPEEPDTLSAQPLLQKPDHGILHLEIVRWAQCSSWLVEFNSRAAPQPASAPTSQSALVDQTLP